MSPESSPRSSPVQSPGFVKTQATTTCYLQGKWVVTVGQKNWLEKLRLNWQEIAKRTLSYLRTQNGDVFKPGLGYCKYVKAKLYLKEGAMAKFNNSRPGSYLFTSKCGFTDTL